MNWGSVGIGLVTAFVAAQAALIISLSWSNGRGSTTSDRDLLAFFLSVSSFVAAFIFGLIVSKFSGGGFLRSTGISIVSILALAVLANLMVNHATYAPVTIGGDGVVLQVEFQLPTNWNKDAESIAQYGCTLNPNGDRGVGEMRSSRSSLIIPCSFPLRSTYKNRTIRLTIQNADDPKSKPYGKAWFDIAFPDDWSLGLNKPWSQWAPGMDHNVESWGPYQVRFRLESESISRAKDQAEREQRLQERWRQFNSISPTAPFERYLDAFEPELPSVVAASEVPARVVTKMAALLKKNPAAFDDALRSNDRKLVRKAVYALSVMPQIPREITPALVDAGHQVVSYIDSARVINLESNNDETDKEALPFLDRWDQALDHAEPPINRADFLAILDEMQNASGKRHSTFRTDLPSRVAMKIDDMTAKRR